MAAPLPKTLVTAEDIARLMADTRHDKKTGGTVRMSFLLDRMCNFIQSAPYDDTTEDRNAFYKPDMIRAARAALIKMPNESDDAFAMRVYGFELRFKRVLPEGLSTFRPQGMDVNVVRGLIMEGYRLLSPVHEEGIEYRGVLEQAYTTLGLGDLQQDIEKATRRRQ